VFVANENHFFSYIYFENDDRSTNSFGVLIAWEILDTKPHGSKLYQAPLNDTVGVTLRKPAETSGGRGE